MLDNLLEAASLGRLLGRRAPGRTAPELSPELSRELMDVLAAAADQLLSARLTFSERRAVFLAAQERLRSSPPAERRAILAHLDRLDRLVPLLGRFGRRFHNLPAEGRRKCLQACERSRWAILADGHGQLRHLVQMAFMQCTEVWPAVPSANGNGGEIPRYPDGRVGSRR